MIRWGFSIKPICANCGHYFWYGETVFHSKHGYRNFICNKCAERENRLMIYRGDNYHHCLECKCVINYGDTVTQGKWGYYCKQCSERENMPNIKITAEVDGKQVPLRTISTESFEAIKALEKPKEIPVPVARIGNWPGNLNDRRLFLTISDHLRRVITMQPDVKLIAIELKSGRVNNTWTEEYHKLMFFDGDLYENIRPL